MKRSKSRLGREGLRLAAEIVPIVLVALLVFHLIRSHVLERYLVPSASMEPTLVGDPERGDIVLVDKLRSGVPRRFDMVVMRNRHDPTRDHLVKRVISTGDEWVWIQDGDVYVGDSRERVTANGPLAKDPIAQRELLVTHFDLATADEDAVSRYWHRDARWRVRDRVIELSPLAKTAADALTPLLPAARAARLERSKPHVPGYLSTLGPVTATFVDRRGVRRGQDVLTRDNGFDLRVHCPPGISALHAVYEYRGHYYGLLYERRGRLLRTLDGGAAGDPVECTPWPVGAAIELTFGYLDGRLFAVVGGRTVWLEALALRDDLAPDGRGSDNLLHLGVIGVGDSARIEALRVFHDAYYAAIQTPLRTTPPVYVEPGEIYVLGDNTFDSRDSRHGLRFGRDDIVGQPWVVVGPWSRRRWLR